MSTHDPATASGNTGFVRAFQALTVLTVLNVLLQFLTAGHLFPDGGPEQLHGAGAITLHLVSGLAAIVAVILWRRNAVTVSLPLLATVVFLATLVQAAIGGRSTLSVHVPGAMVLTLGVTWLLVLALRLSPRPVTARSPR
jgi:hypothetical protein